MLNYICWVYSNNAKTNEAQFWLSLREFIIQHHDDVHRKLRPGGIWSNANSGPSLEKWPDVEAYMGLFEHIYDMLEEGLISDKIFKNIYRYRLINIIVHIYGILTFPMGMPTYGSFLKNIICSSYATFFCVISFIVFR
jgi:hypothetical protein